MKRSWKKTGLVVVVMMILLSAVMIKRYINSYYRAEDFAVTMTNDAVSGENCLIFAPKEDTDIGLIFYPGGLVEFSAYAPLMRACSSKGICCILYEMPANLAFLNVDVAKGIEEKHPEITHWYIGGHSLGGVAAAMCLDKHRELYEGLILLASYSTADFSDSDMRVLQVYGEEDGVLNLEKMKESAKNLPADTQVISIHGGNHAGFGNYGKQDQDGDAMITNGEQMRITADCIDRFVHYMN